MNVPKFRTILNTILNTTILTLGINALRSKILTPISGAPGIKIGD